MVSLRSIGESLKNRFPGLYRIFMLHIRIGVWRYYLPHNLRLKRIRNKGKAKVVFFASSLGMWRYQEIYEKLCADNRFECHIIVHPFNSYSSEEKANACRQLCQYFDGRKIPYICGWESDIDAGETMKILDPDILFYPQPYGNLFGNGYDSRYFRKRLLCLYPYGLYTLDSPGIINQDFHSLAWRLFYTTSYDLDEARQHAFNRGRNVVVAGNPIAGRLTCDGTPYKWKNPDRNVKRIIWAPHFTLNGNAYLHRSSFLWMHDVMTDIAREFDGYVQFVFKPHPRLKTELYSREDWGKERTDLYYNLWRNGSNTMIEEGEFTELFATSDAMIHDCGSFTAEYLYTVKPVMFTTGDIEAVMRRDNRFGRECLRLHYIGTSKKDIREFIINVVLGGNDPLMRRRRRFRDEVLMPPGTPDTADNTYYAILRGIGWDTPQTSC